MNRNTLLILAASLAAGMSTATIADSDSEDEATPAQADTTVDRRVDERSDASQNVDADTTAENRMDDNSDASQNVRDVAITAKVKSKLLADRSTQGLKIDVDTQGGVVTLSGNVSSDAEKKAAEQIAKGTDDVKTVNNELKVVNT